MPSVARSALVALSLLGASAAPANAALQVSFVPAAAQLSPEGRARVLVVVANKGHVTVKAVTLRPLAVGSDGLNVTMRPDGPRDLTAGATRTWYATVKTTNPLLGERSVTLVARHAGGSDVASATLAVTLASPANAKAVVEARAAQDAVSARPGSRAVKAAILIDNHGPVPLRLARAIVAKPDHVDVDLHGARPTVAPGETAVLDFDVHVLDGARPGKTTAIVRLNFAGGLGGRGLEAVVTQPVEVETPTQDALLVALGIPGLVLVPGIIILATASLLWSVGFLRERWDARAFPVAFPSPEFWIAAVPLSVALAVGAHLVGVDLLNTYSLGTVLWVWLVSTGIGAVLYAIAVAVRNFRHGRRTPAPNDQPIALLRKLHRQRLTVRLRRFQHGDGSYVYLVQRDDGSPDACWFAPGIAFRWDDSDDALGQELPQLVDGSGDAGKVADALKKGVKGKVLTVSWEDGGSGDGPRLLPVNDLKERDAGAIVHAT